jgi:hypothetical protein
LWAKASPFEIPGMKFFPAIAALLAVALLFPSKTLGGGKSKKATRTAPVDTSDHITAVDLTSITINIFATHVAKQYQVTTATTITVNGRPTKLDGLATGMSVIVTPSPDGFTAVNIEAKTLSTAAH